MKFYKIITVEPPVAEAETLQEVQLWDASIANNPLTRPIDPACVDLEGDDES
jgi:hypothetical protein